MLSTPISMDLVGLNYFEVDFSKSTNKIDTDNNEDVSKTNKHVDEVKRTDSNSGFVIPVACDVSVQRYCKLVQLYSTVCTNSSYIITVKSCVVLIIIVNASKLPLNLYNFRLYYLMPLRCHSRYGLIFRLAYLQRYKITKQYVFIQLFHLAVVLLCSIVTLQFPDFFVCDFRS